MAASLIPRTSSDRPKTRPRYTLRALLVFVTLVCVAIGYWFREQPKREITYPPGHYLWTESHGNVYLGREVQQYRRVLRGEPAPAGPVQLFDQEGRRIGEEFRQEELRHGRWARWYSNGNLRERGRYRLGKKEGAFERYDERGKLVLRMAFADDRPHGNWRVYHDGKLVQSIWFEQGHTVQPDVRSAADPLARALEQGTFKDRVPSRPTKNVSELKLGDLPKYVTDVYGVTIGLDRKCGSRLGEPLSPLEADNLPLVAMLALVCRPRGLAPTYRFGQIWITTAEDAMSWVDRTGAGELLAARPTEMPQADWDEISMGLKRPSYLGFNSSTIDTVARMLTESYRVPTTYDESLASRKITIEVRGVPLYEALGALCDQHDLRVRCKDDGTLVLEPQDGS